MYTKWNIIISKKNEKYESYSIILFDFLRNFISTTQVIFHLIELNESYKNDSGHDPWISIFTEIDAKNLVKRALLITRYWDEFWSNSIFFNGIIFFRSKFMFRRNLIVASINIYLEKNRKMVKNRTPCQPKNVCSKSFNYSKNGIQRFLRFLRGISTGRYRGLPAPGPTVGPNRPIQTGTGAAPTCLEPV